MPPRPIPRSAPGADPLADPVDYVGAVHLALLTESRYLGDLADLADLPESSAAGASSASSYLANILTEDTLLALALGPHRARVTRVDWADPAVDWGSFDAAVFRTTWDYFERFPEFQAFLERVSAHLPLVNPVEIIRWNIDKHYLLDLRDRGVPIVPTVACDRGGRVHLLSDVLAAHGWDEAVIKPAVSGAARETWRVRRGDPAADARFAALVANEDMLVQPLVADVLTRGEVSIVVLGGRATHAVRKIPKAGDFRVQDDHGGHVVPHTPEPDELAAAERAVAACSPRPAYARVDLVRDASGVPALMELELVEPELFLRFQPPAAEDFAAAIVASVRA